jgi:hypothetical protein
MVRVRDGWDMSPKVFLLTIAALVAWTSACPAGEPIYSPLRRLWVGDWQEPQDLPPRFRNHCSFDPSWGRPYCADHCGPDYQIYYCSRWSFGCCHIGTGHCGSDGLLRCRP